MKTIILNLTETPKMYAHPMHRSYAEYALDAGVITQEQLDILTGTSNRIFAGKSRIGQMNTALQINGLIHKHAVMTDKSKLVEELEIAFARALKVPTYKIGGYGRDVKACKGCMVVNDVFYNYSWEFEGDNLLVHIEM